MELREALALRDEFLPRVQAFAELLSARQPLKGMFGDWMRRLTGRPPAPFTFSIGVSLGSTPGDCAISVRTTGAFPLLAGSLLEDLAARAGRLDIRRIRPAVAESGGIEGPMSLPLRIGSSVSHLNVAPGTLGCFVRDRATSKHGILSNNHVLSDDGGNPNDGICHHYRTGALRRDTIGWLERCEPLWDNGNKVDAAVAFIDAEPIDPANVGDRIQLSGRCMVPTQRTKVAKYGRKTGYREGVVSTVGLASVNVEINGRIKQFVDQIEVESDAARPFSETGDSGSLVVTEGGDAVGLVFAGAPEAGGTRKFSYVCPMERILDCLRVELFIGHGSA